MENKSKWIYIFIAVVVLMQFAVPFTMMMERECIVRHAPRMWLQTGPVDPRDPFRGDYVVLSYPVETTIASLADSSRTQWEQRRDYTSLFKNSTVYATFELDSKRMGHLKTVSNELPDSGLNLKFSRGALGLGKLFVQQGEGRKLENRAGRSWSEYTDQDFSTPLAVEVAVGRSGKGVLTGNYFFAKPYIALRQIADSAIVLGFFCENITDKPITLCLNKAGHPAWEIVKAKPSFGTSPGCKTLNLGVRVDFADCTEKKVLAPGESYSVPLLTYADAKELHGNNTKDYWYIQNCIILKPTETDTARIVSNLHFRNNEFSPFLKDDNPKK